MTHYVYSPSLGKSIEVEELDTGIKPSKHRRREADLFIMVPLRLLAISGVISYAARILLILLLHLKFEARRSTFPCPNGFLERYGISRQTKYLALAELEAAGFIAVQRFPRRSPIVTLLKS